MIVETALKAAGPGSVLASRPAGVAHVVGPGPLTPSGRFIPRSRRAVCRTRTRQLRVLDVPPSFTSLHPAWVGALPRLCVRCSARLERCLTTPPVGAAPQAGRAEQHPHQVQRGHRHRDELRAAHSCLTRSDLWVCVWLAETPAEVDQVAWLSLLLLGSEACREWIPAGRPFAGWSLNRAIGQRRSDLDHSLTAATAAHLDAAREKATAIRKADRDLDREIARREREALLPAHLRSS